jgi:hypothetical protein
MKVAVMQPYFFPYLGYFQLIAAVDKFVLYDDVNFINRGWINRNNILIAGKPSLISVPLSGASQNKRINDIYPVADSKWVKTLLKTIEHNYRQAPFFQEAFSILESTLNDTQTDIAKINLCAIQKVCEYLSIQTQLIPSSCIYDNIALKGQERILDICLKENATDYINPIGGTELYDSQFFKKDSISIHFLRPLPVAYKQFNQEFVPWLSILDVLMFNSKESTCLLLKKFELI